MGRSKCIQVGAGSVLARFSFGSGSVLGRRWVLVGVFLDVAATKYRLFLIFKIIDFLVTDSPSAARGGIP